ncbi:MAG: oligosaccharide flippase family protein [Flavobacteriales bacterium]|nr:oligosaccharide flippase family protein [Flavobacteriales bacterium]
MGIVKTLGSQTAYYGLSSMVGRLLNYLLVPLYSYTIVDPSRLGIVTYLYAFAALFNVLLTYGMETAFFRYSSDRGWEKKKVANTAFTSLFISTTVMMILGLVFYKNIAQWIDYQSMSICVLYFVVIVAADTYATIPFAQLRLQGRAAMYAVIRMVGILVGIALNVLFIYFLPKMGVMEVQVENIFLSNVVSSVLVLALLMYYVKGFSLKIDTALWKKMIVYGLPILIAGTAGIINETMDRVFLRMLLPADVSEYWLGVYGNCFKMAIFITLFIQAFRFAAEPFFFSHANDRNAPQTYAKVSLYFTVVVGAMYVGIMANLPWLQYFIGPSYRVGIDIVPIILFANICIGLYYNLSMWYKLTDRTLWGAGMSIMGAMVTVIVIFYGVPRYGYMAAAWAHLITYASMMIVSYFLGQKYYPIPYNIPKILLFLALAWVAGYVSWYVLGGNVWVGNAFFVVYCAVVILTEIKSFRKMFLHR